MSRLNGFLILPALLAVAVTAGCTATPAPDYRIRVMPAADGKTMVAVPPECPNWREYANNPEENQYGIQFGCANARNLAAHVVRKQDLIEGKSMGAADATYTAATINNYRAGRTKPLIDAWSEAPSAGIATGAGKTP